MDRPGTASEKPESLIFTSPFSLSLRNTVKCFFVICFQQFFVMGGVRVGVGPCRRIIQFHHCRLALSCLVTFCHNVSHIQGWRIFTLSFFPSVLLLAASTKSSQTTDFQFLLRSQCPQCGLRSPQRDCSRQPVKEGKSEIKKSWQIAQRNIAAKKRRGESARVKLWDLRHRLEHSRGRLSR